MYVLIHGSKFFSYKYFSKTFFFFYISIVLVYVIPLKKDYVNSHIYHTAHFVCNTVNSHEANHVVTHHFITLNIIFTCDQITYNHM